jgi:UDP-2-acetamido-3-amino-2,3-dideoxy-glucuronate N-acetyltransferase
MKEVFVHPTATVEKSARLGKGTKIWHYSHVREGAVMGENCMTGHCVYIDRDVHIGNNVKIQNKSSVFRGVTLEDNVFIGPHVAFTNDLRPRVSDEWELKKTLVRTGASIGVNCTILCGITIGKHAMIGGGSVVTKGVPNHGLAYGDPAKLRGFVCRCGETLKRGSEKDDFAEFKCPKCGFSVKIEKAVYSRVV